MLENMNTPSRSVSIKQQSRDLNFVSVPTSSLSISVPTAKVLLQSNCDRNVILKIASRLVCVITK